MAKQNTLIHVNSNELNYTGDGAKNPQITDLNYGEIAINIKVVMKLFSLKMI